MKYSRHLPISNIYLKEKRNWINTIIDKVGWIGFDTETYNGKCLLLTDSFERYICNPTFKDCLDFLFYRSNKNYYRAFWNIDFDISSMLKIWNDIEKIDELIHGKEVLYEGYSLFFIRNRLFVIKKGHHSVHFIDLYNMYRKKLGVSGLEHLQEGKIDIIDSEKLNVDMVYWENNIDDIIKYCIQDSILVSKLGSFLSDKIKEAKLLLPKYLTSHASISKQYFRHFARIPSTKYIPTNIMDISFQTYLGGRFELIERGYFDDIFNYDINSAYPSFMCNLPSLKHGYWKKVDTINEHECIGYYRALFEIPKCRISPFGIRTKKNIVIYPYGKIMTWITWYEADLLRKYDIKVDYGYEYIPNEKEYYPLRERIKIIYELKTINKDVNDVLYWLFKLIINSLYGTFLEKHMLFDGLVEAGILFNPVWASMITAQCRWRLLKDIKESDYKHILGFHTDSLLSNTKLNLNISNELGAWSLDKKGSGVLLKTGIYQIGDLVKRRCFSSKKVNWIELLKKHKKLTKIPVERIHVYKIAESLRRFKNIDLVNVFKKETRYLDINTENKRVWNDNFRNCKDVLSRHISSSPIEIGYYNTKNLK